jgi:hypothetical protein
LQRYPAISGAISGGASNEVKAVEGDLLPPFPELEQLKR